ncbi:LysE family translocator [Luteibacter sp. NPDC031894]|jgi:threonine/homoserine/homoserine lactone efflux protein|uniref:LysE family translocator n=1 Tax=Luteibacter sp. NPDC031894 TaxID=3390572 RepID=UPI003D070345
MTSTPLLAAGTLLLVASLTPGPNNLVVLRTAATSTSTALSLAMGGIVLGGMTMLALVVAAGSLMRDLPFLRTMIAVAGAVYLAWLGWSMLRSPVTHEHGAALPAGFVGLFAFQFCNPKSWVMVLSLVASFPQRDATTILVWLAPLFLAIPSTCLLLWALAGRHLARHLQAPGARRRFDRIMGLSLIASAVLLLL